VLVGAPKYGNVSLRDRLLLFIPLRFSLEIFLANDATLNRPDMAHSLFGYPTLQSGSGGLPRDWIKSQRGKHNKSVFVLNL